MIVTKICVGNCVIDNHPYAKFLSDLIYWRYVKHVKRYRSFVLCGQGSSLLWIPALRPYSSPVRLPRERKGIGRCVRCVLATCGEGTLSRSELLLDEYFYSAFLLDVAYCLA